jgi:hypothetical protein
LPAYACSGPMRLPHLIGRGDKSTRPPLDRLFVLSHAHARLEREHQLTPRGTGAIVFHPVPPSDFVSILRRAEDAAKSTAAATAVEGSTIPSRSAGWFCATSSSTSWSLASMRSASGSRKPAGGRSYFAHCSRSRTSATARSTGPTTTNREPFIQLPARSEAITVILDESGC